MKARLLIVILYLFLLFVIETDSYAANELYSFQTLQQKQQFTLLTQKLRCLVCQNENLADSYAPLAVDLRNQIYTMVQKGKSDKEIQDYLVARYGDFILFTPPLENKTILLWVAPMLLLIIGFIILWRVVKTRKSNS